MVTARHEPPQADTVPSVENIAPGITREWLFDKRIMVLTISNVRRHTVDTYCDLLKQAIQEWPDDRPYLALYDHLKVSLTPYVREQMRGMHTIRPELKGYIAVVVTSLFAPLANIMIGVREPLARQATMFRTREAGLDWLIKKLPKEE